MPSRGRTMRPWAGDGSSAAQSAACPSQATSLAGRRRPGGPRLRLSNLRRGVSAVALCCVTTTGAGAVPAPALADTQGTPPAASIAEVRVARERLHVRLGRSVAVIGRVQPGAAGYTARLQIW